MKRLINIFFLFVLQNIFILPLSVLADNEEKISSSNITEKPFYDNEFIKTVISNGYGKTIDMAARNAAKNALTEVVGTFIDSKTQLINQQKIINSVIIQTKKINKDIKEYSQGSISYFEIIDIKDRSGIIDVTARVDVKTKEFEKYLSNLSYSFSKVDTGMYTELSTNIKNQEDKLDIYINSIILPITRGEVVNIKMGKAYPYKKFVSEIREIKLNKNMDPMSTIIVPFTFSLNKDFLTNIKDILSEISDNHNNQSIISTNNREGITRNLFFKKNKINKLKNKLNENAYLGIKEKKLDDYEENLYVLLNIRDRFKRIPKYKKYDLYAYKYGRYQEYEGIPFFNEWGYLSTYADPKTFFKNKKNAQLNFTNFYNSLKFSLLDSSGNEFFSCFMNVSNKDCNIDERPGSELFIKGGKFLSLIERDFHSMKTKDMVYSEFLSHNVIITEKDFYIIFDPGIEKIKLIDNIKLEYKKRS